MSQPVPGVPSQVGLSSVQPGVPCGSRTAPLTSPPVVSEPGLVCAEGQGIPELAGAGVGLSLSPS